VIVREKTNILDLVLWQASYLYCKYENPFLLSKILTLRDKNLISMQISASACSFSTTNRQFTLVMLN